MAEYLSRSDAAAALTEMLGLPVTKRTLEKLAERGEGPPYVILIGQAAYPLTGLRPWAERAAKEPRARAFREKRHATPIAA